MISKRFTMRDVIILTLLIVATVALYLFLPPQWGANSAVRVVEVTVQGGYEPEIIVVKAGQPVRLNFTRRESSRCGDEVVLPDFDKRAQLPENKTVGVLLMPATPGEFEFTCDMNMMRGKLVVEP